MNKIKRWIQLLLFSITLIGLISCGQKGDLYLPQGQAMTVMVG